MCKLNIAHEPMTESDQPNVSCSVTFDKEENRSASRKHRVKSRPTQTERTFNDGESVEDFSNFAQLQKLFPKANVDRVKHILDMTGNCLDDTVNVLLDSAETLSTNSENVETVPEGCVFLSESFPSHPVIKVMEEVRPKSSINDISRSCEDFAALNSCSDDSLTLELDSNFADKLQELFGSVSTHNMPAS